MANSCHRIGTHSSHPLPCPFSWDFRRKQALSVIEQDVKKMFPCHFSFFVKYFPEDIAEEVVQEATQHLFFLQAKQMILNRNIYCPPEAAVLLASYAVQAKYGDFDPNIYKPGTLILEEFLPARVMEQYQMTSEMWEERIRTWYADHIGMSRDEAEMEYLKIVQDLDMFGVNYFPIRNKKDTELWLGVTSLGLNIYEKDNQLQPKINFPWSEVRNVSCEDKKFVIRPVDKTAPNFVIITENPKVNKVILDLCSGNHDLYMRRRRPDTMEVQQMKAQAKEEKLRRQMERTKLLKEKQLREAAEREKMSLEQRLSQYQEEMRLANEALRRSEETADLLNAKVRVTEEEAALLQQKAIEAEEELNRLRIQAMKSEEEKLLYERRMREAELLAAQMLEEAERRVNEAEYLKVQLSQAKMAERQAKERLVQYCQVPVLASQPTVPVLPLYSQSRAPSVDVASDIQGLRLNDRSPDLLSTYQIDNSEVDTLAIQIEKERVEYLEKSKHLHEQLKELRSEIDILKVEDKQSILDQLHQEHKRGGEDKYSTLRKTQSGSTHTRVAFFEEL
ncbi:hypothetical protein QYM36_009060 [Artemia franciscana]|uniref:Moesin/ezrin/radixin homolog 1 n=1 Tax=Artemia franciscana TaxID=6661 RepID=A0AA88LB00_ARTSF|nr:hypothetical protein QYM36_009060 [Artemia franciscana]